MNRPAEFITDPRFLDISEDGETQRLKLLEDLRAYSAILRQELFIEAGFEFAESIPRAALGLVPQKGSTKRGACIHDHLYLNGGYRIYAPLPGGEPLIFRVPITRAQADAVYHEFLRVKGCGRASAYLRWLGVRAGGWVAWNAHRKLRP